MACGSEAQKSNATMGALSEVGSQVDSDEEGWMDPFIFFFF